jgi:hypothetical protein
MFEFLDEIGTNQIMMILLSPAGLVIGGFVLYWGWMRKNKKVMRLGGVIILIGVIYSIMWGVRGFPWNK